VASPSERPSGHRPAARGWPTVRPLPRLAGLPALLAALRELLAAVTGMDQFVGRTDAALTDRVLGAPARYTAAEVARSADVPLPQARALWRGLGLPEIAEDAPELSQVDVDALRDLARLVHSGVIDMPTAVGMARPMGHLMSRLAAAQLEAMRSALADEGNGESENAAWLEAAASELLPSLNRLVLYTWHRHLAVAVEQELAVQTGQGEEQLAIGFVDIVGYTALSRRVEPAALAGILDDFEAAVFETVRMSGGRVVKTIGDGVLFSAGDVPTAADVALSLTDGSRPQLPRLHAGLSCGPVLNRAGDVFGATVNRAERLTELAAPRTVRVDREVAEQLRGRPGYRLGRPRPRPVRGYPKLVSYRLSRLAAR
jgi:adenylate cyclase